jgi:uncharacterized membrane protein YhaH (DUF805 family)
MSDETLDHVYRGVGRLYYFLARVMLIAVTVFAVIYFGPDSGVFRFVSLGSMVAGIVLDVMRLRNIGVSEWWVFLRFLPWVGLFMSIGLQSAQTGWAESKRLDKSGWAIVGVHAALIALIVFLVFRAPRGVFLPEFFF